MNSNYRVRNFTLIVVSVYLLISVVAYFNNWHWMQRVNLIGNITTLNSNDSVTYIAEDNIDTVAPIVIQKSFQRDFSKYLLAGTVTNFSTDTTTPSLKSFAQKLQTLKSGKKIKIRVAYLGDSMIEGDLLTQSLRAMLQAEFGGAGVGFVPINSPNISARSTLVQSLSKGWKDESFKTTGNKYPLYLSGHNYTGENEWVKIKDQTIVNKNLLTEKSLICGYANHPISISVDGIQKNIQPTQLINRIPLKLDESDAINFEINDNQLPVFGLSFESPDGIIIDNFSFRGITGVEYNKIDASTLTEIAEQNPYDLIVFQYGVNLLFRPKDKNYNWYAKMVTPAIQKIKTAFPNASILLTGTADRAFDYDGEFKSAIGIDSLLKIQAALAYENDLSFYNHFSSMGGRNSIVKWANASPTLANKDYVHPNARGAQQLAQYLFDAIMQDYKKITITQ